MKKGVKTYDPAIIKKDICLFCGTELDYQNDGELDDDYNELFAVVTRIIDVRCPNCGAKHTAKFIIDKKDYIACNTDDYQVRVGNGFMNVYGTREEYNIDTDDYEDVEFDYYMDCVSIYAEQLDDE